MKRLLKLSIQIYLASATSLASLVLGFVELASKGTITGLTFAPMLVLLICYLFTSICKTMKEMVAEYNQLSDE